MCIVWFEAGMCGVRAVTVPWSVADLTHTHHLTVCTHTASYEQRHIRGSNSDTLIFIANICGIFFNTTLYLTCNHSLIQ